MPVLRGVVVVVALLLGCALHRGGRQADRAQALARVRAGAAERGETGAGVLQALAHALARVHLGPVPHRCLARHGRPGARVELHGLAPVHARQRARVAAMVLGILARFLPFARERVRAGARARG